MLSRDKRLTLNTWDSSGLQENAFGNQFSTFDSPRDHPQGIHERGSVPQATRSRTLFPRDDNKIEAQFQCQHLQEGRRLRVR